MADLTSLLKELDRIDADARELTQDLSDAQMNWRPNEGAGWSIAQCLDHLTRGNGIYVTVLRAGIAKTQVKSSQPTGVLRPGLFGQIFVSSLEPPVRLKLPAPKRIVPADHRTKQEALSDFLGSHESLRTLIRESTGLDWNRLIIRNPFIRVVRMKAATALLVMTAHDRRHLWQAAQVRRCFSA